MKKQQLILGSVLALSIAAVPMVAQARRGADDPIGHVRQEDRRANRQEDKTPTTPASTSTTPSAVTTRSSDDDSNSTGTVAAATITIEQATATAQEKFPEKSIYKVEQEVEHGVLVWKVKFTDDSRVDVDATTGEIVRSRDRALETSNSGSSHDSDDNDSDDDEDSSNSGRSANSGRDHSEDD